LPAGPSAPLAWSARIDGSAVTRTGVIVHVPLAEPLVGRWRLRHTYDAPLGMPPHVTLLFPFFPTDQLTDEVEARLARLLGEADAFDVTFAQTARFPDVLYLEPQPSAPFAALTDAIAAEWPEHPPYEGVHETVIPHLTVAESEDEALLQQIGANIEPGLPFRTRVSEAQLYTEDSAGRWHERSRLPLAP
jgi:2'-5' RNA ligase